MMSVVSGIHLTAVLALVLVLMIASAASVSAAPAITDCYNIESRTSTMSFFKMSFSIIN